MTLSVSNQLCRNALMRRLATILLPVFLAAVGTLPLAAQSFGPATGSLILAGGGRLDNGIFQRFVDLAGGPRAKIVLIPTAGTADHYDNSWSGVRRFEGFELAELTVLHTRDPKEANTEAFVAPLRQATGVWFSGGRQWRLADAYLNTLTHRALWNVLDRGGVIGGSSAGATIQGSYLVRGDTRTNTILMGDHEEGMAFLKNVGVDQHLLRLNRQFDLLPVIRKHPDLLGIGIDEGTAIVVQGDTFEVIGNSYVAIYEPAQINHPARPFHLLAPGQKYTMTNAPKPLEEILFGSCIQEAQPIPILNTVLQRHPRSDLFLFLGDNIYADTTDPAVMRAKYQRLGTNPSFRQLRATLPVMATWDDHDFGLNDAGADYGQKTDSENQFLDFWKTPADSVRRQRPGIYEARTIGPAGKRTQIILLDTRYFRSPLAKGEEKRVGGPYIPSTAADKTLLGAEQWAWLETVLQEPAELRVVVSSIQLVADDAGQECWANLPRERARFFELLRRTQAAGVVVISGDRHWSELSAETEALPYPVFDLTSSSLNQPHSRGTPTDNTKRALAKTYHQENYGRLAIDWNAEPPQLRMEIRDLDGRSVLAKSLSLTTLGSPQP